MIKRCPHGWEPVKLCDKGCNDMTPQSPKAVTAEKYMQKIFTLLQLPMTYDSRNGIPKGAYESVAEQIKLAQEQAREEGIVEGVSSQAIKNLLEQNYAKGFSDGQVAMRENVRQVLQKQMYRYRTNGCEKEYISLSATEGLIRGLRPHAPGEGK